MTTSLIEQVPLPGRSRVAGNRGAVTAMTSGAARAGGEILAAGGNAADAAVAAGLAAGVVEPAMNGLGGTAYAVVFRPGEHFDGRAGRQPALSGPHPRGHVRSAAGCGWGPLRVSPDARGPGGDRAAQRAGPDGSRGSFELHRRFGRLSFEAVTEPAIRLAEEGFVPDWVFAVHAAAGYRRLKRCPAAFALYTREDGSPFVPFGEEDRMRNPDLAGSLRLLAVEGPEPFYLGSVARRLAEAVSVAGGILQESDFGQIPVREVSPLRFGYRDSEVATLPANSGAPPSPPLSPIWTPSLPRDLRPAPSNQRSGSSIWRRSRFGWRFWIASPTWAIRKVLRCPFPVCSVLTTSARGGRECLRTVPGIRTPAAQVPPMGETFPNPPPSGGPSSDCTTHVNAMDADGMAVSLTATLGGRFGSAFAAPGLGYP